MKTPNDETTEEVSDEQWQSEDEWEQEAELCEPRSEPIAVQAVQFPLDELNAIRAAAERAGVRTSEYIRRAATEKVEREKQARARTA